MAKSKDQNESSMVTPAVAFGPGEIARLCHVAPETVYRWIEEGKLPAFRTAGGHRRVWSQDVEALMKKLNLRLPEVPKKDVIPTVLVVDDEEPIRRLVRRTIETGWPRAAVVEAADGFEGGRQVMAAHPHVIVLDVMLPGVDGNQVCQTIRKDPQLAGVKILAISGAGESAHRRIMEAGADDFLAKPFSLDVLHTKLAALMPVMARGQGAE